MSNTLSFFEPLKRDLENYINNHADSMAAEAVNKALNNRIAKDPSKSIHITLPGNIERRLEGELSHYAMPDVLVSLACGNVALIGPAGSGKTTMAAQCAKALGLDFYFNGALQNEYKLTGFIDAKGEIVKTPFRHAFENGGVYLFDEIDASSPQALLAFNAALSNGQMDFPDKVVEMHPDFRCIAAANTYWTGADRQYVGRNQLDAATIDRFIMIEIDYDEDLERMLAGNDNWVKYVQAIRNKCKADKIRHVVSPRASALGARLLQAGVEPSKVKDMVVFKGLDSATKERIISSLPFEIRSLSLKLSVEPVEGAPASQVAEVKSKKKAA
jgi:hypothetical protein